MTPKAASTPEELKRQVQDWEVRQVNRERDLIDIMSTETGRRFMWSLLADTGMFHSRFEEKSLRLYWIEGRRALGLALFNELTAACPELFWKMQAENVKKSNNTEVSNG